MPPPRAHAVTPRAPNPICGRLTRGIFRGALKKFGINADLKHGNSIVAAPHSHHEKDRNFVYSWDGCDETVIRDLPPFNVQALQRIIDAKSPQHVEMIAPAKMPPKVIATEGERRDTLNKLLCRHAHDYAEHQHDNFFDLARSFNDSFLPPLEDTDVMKTASDVWKDRPKLQKWTGRRPTARTNDDEIDRLNRHGKNSGDAHLFLAKLRLLHGARCARGETFAISATAMARKKVMQGWSRKRYEKAREILLKENFVKMVLRFKVTAAGRLPAQYRLVSLPVVGGGAAAGS